MNSSRKVVHNPKGKPEGWYVESEDGSHFFNDEPYATKAEAQKLLDAVEMGKHDENSRLPAQLERRAFVGNLELRSAPEGSKSPGTLVGYAAVYGRLSCDLGYFREQLEPGCFADALKTADVRALKNHDESLLLGRLKSGTLRLVEDEIGLRMEIDLPDTHAGRDVAEEVRRGDMSGCSFSFTTDVDQWDFSGPTTVRTVRKVKDLYDVGPVTFPAYDETSVAVRSYRQALETRNRPPSPPVSVQLAKARIQLAEALHTPSL